MIEEKYWEKEVYCNSCGARNRLTSEDKEIHEMEGYVEYICYHCGAWGEVELKESEIEIVRW